MKKSGLKILIAILAVALVVTMSLVMFVACNDKDIIERRTVTFMNGDEVFAKEEVDLGAKYTFPEEVPTQDQPDDEHEMVFVGWTLDKDYYEYRSEILTEPDYVVADIVIYAAFRKVQIDSSAGAGADKEYEVEFRMPTGEDFGEWSGVTLDQFTQKVKRYQNAILPKEEEMPKITGYHFTGEWTGGTLTDVRGRRRVTAVYEKNVYTLTWHYLDKTEEMKKEYRAAIDLTQTPKVDEAFIFIGWFDDAEFEKEATLTEMPDRDVDIYAKYRVDFSTASVSKEGTMVYGDAQNNLYVSGLKECEGLEYTFVWTVNGEVGSASEVRNFALKDAGRYTVGLHIYANFKDGILVDEADAKTSEASTEFVFDLSKATLTGVVTLSKESVVYGDAAPTASIEYSGFVFDETVESAGIAQTFIYKQGESDVTGKDLHVGAYSVETIPQDNPNYQFAQIETKQFTVTKKDLDVTASVSDFVYGTPLTFVIGFDGFVLNENESVLGEHWFTLNNEGKYVGQERLHAGAYSAKLQGFGSDDYNVKLPEAFGFVVSKRPASAQIAAEGGIYGATPKISYSFTDVLPEDEERFVPTYAYQRGGNPYSLVDRFVVGEYSVTASFAEKDFSDYQTLTVTEATFSIVQKHLAVSVNVNTSYVYGETIRPSLSYEDAFEFGDSQTTPGLLIGTARYTYRTASDAKAYDSARFEVNDYTVEAYGLTSANYIFDFPMTAFSVTKKGLDLTVHLENDTILYGTTPKVATADGFEGGISYEGFVFGETANSVFGNDLPKVYYLDSKDSVTTQFHAGKYMATTSADPRNYSVTVHSVELTVTRRTLSVDIDLPSPEMVYGEKPNSTKIVYVADNFDGFVFSDKELYTASAYVEYAGKQSYTQAQLASAKMVVDTYKVSVKGIDDKINDDYDVTYAYLENGNELTFAITPASLKVTLSADKSSYIYGSIPTIKINYEGFAYNETEEELFGENASKVLYRNTATKAKSEGKLGIGEYDATLDGIQNANYTVELKEHRFDVTRKTLTVIISAAGFTYGDKAMPEPTLSYRGFAYDEDDAVVKGTPSYAYTRGANAGDVKTAYSKDFFDAGEYTVTVDGLQADNYSFDYGSGRNFTVAKRNFTATVSAKSITYGDDAIFGYESNVLERDKEDFDFRFVFTYRSDNISMYRPYDPSDYAHYQAGYYRVSLACTPTSNYNDFTAKEVGFTVAKRPFTAEIVANGDITYGEDEKVNYTHRTTDILSDDEAKFNFRLVLKYHDENSERYTDLEKGDSRYQAGSYQVVLEYDLDSNYEALAQQPTAEFKVLKKQLTITVNAADITYGESAAPSISETGLVTGDEELIEAPKFSYTKGNLRGNIFHAGAYTVTVENIVSNNYDITITPCDFTVKKADITVTVSATGYTYGEQGKPRVSLEYGAFKHSDNAQKLGTPSYIYKRSATADGEKKDHTAEDIFKAGYYTIDVNGLASEDYNIIVNSKDIVIEKAQLTVTVSVKGFKYDGEKVPEPTLSYKGFVNSQSSDVLGGEVAYAYDGNVREGVYHAGEYTVTPSGYTSENYEITYTQGSFTVSPREVTITLAKGWTTYADDKTDYNWYTLSGDAVLNKELTFGVSFTKDDLEYENGSETYFSVGKYVVSVGYEENADYIVKHNKEEIHGSASAEFTIGAKEVTLTVQGGNAPWASRKEWSQTPTISDPRFTLEGKIGFKIGEEDISADSYTNGADGGLGDHFEWKGEYSVKLEGTDTDVTKNFVFRYVINITLDNSSFKVTTPKNTTFTYDGKPHSFEVTATADGGIEDIVYSYCLTQNGNYVPKIEITDWQEGGYTVWYKVNATNATEAKGSFQVTVKKADMTVVAPNDVKETYAPGANRFASVTNISGVKDDSNFKATVLYGKDSADCAEESLTLTNVKDSCTVHFEVSAGDNYNEVTGSYTVTIAKATVTVPTIAHKTYQKDTQQKAEVPDGSGLYTVTKNDGGTDAGSYDVEITLNDADNYKWTDSEESVKMLTFVIDKATVGRPTQNNETFTYNAEQQTYTPVGFNKETMKIDGNEQTDAKTYTVTVSLSDSNNYKWSTGAEKGTISFNFVIGKAEYREVTVSARQSYTYDAQSHGTGVTFKGVGAEEKPTGTSVKYSYQGVVDSEDEPKFTNYQNGGYTVNYTISGNNNYEDATGSYTVTINKAEYREVTVIAKQSYTYDAQAHGTGVTFKGVEKELAPTGASVKYSWGELKGQLTAPTFTNYQDGGYAVNYTISGNANYNDYNGSYTVNIAQAEPTIELPEQLDQSLQQKGITLKEQDGTKQLQATYNASDRGSAFASAVRFANKYGDAKVEFALETVQAGISLAAELAWTTDIEGIELTQAGSYILHVKVSGDNYVEKEETFAITVDKADMTVVAPKNVEETYAPGENRFASVTNIKGVNGDNSFKATVKYGTEDGAYTADTLTLTNFADSCTVYFKVSADNYNDYSGSYTVTINKATFTVTGVSDVGATYDGNNKFKAITKDNATVEGLLGGEDITVTYSQDKEGEYGEAWEIKNATNSGAVTVWYKVSAGDNYNEVTGSYTVTIAKATVTVPTIAHKTYNKQNQTADIDEVGKDYTVTKNNGGTDAGSYDVELTLNDADNYKWADSEESVKTLTFVIDKASLTRPTANTSDEFKYNGNEQTYSLDAFGFDDETMTITGNVQTNAGDHTVTVSLKHPNNYKWSDGEENDSTFTFKIAKAEYQNVIVTAEQSYTYDAQAHGTGVTFNGVGTELEPTGAVVKYSWGEVKDQLTAPTFTNYQNGGYTVNYTISGNDNYENVTGSYIVNIAQAIPTVELPDADDPKLAENGLTIEDLNNNNIKLKGTYNASNLSEKFVDVLKFANKYGDATVEYAFGEGNQAAELDWTTDLSEIILSQAGSYTLYVRVSGDNYETTNKTFAIIIDKANMTVVANDVEETFAPGANRFVPITNIKGVEGDSSFKATVKYGTEDGVYTADTLTLINVADSGIVYFKVTAEGGNYNDFNGSYKVTIAKAELDKLPEGVNKPSARKEEVLATKGLTLGAVCDLSEFGANWSWKVAAASTALAAKADKYSFTAQYTDPSGNYLPYDVIVSFTVRKEKIIVSFDAGGLAVIFGAGFGTDNSATALSNVTGITCTGEGNRQLTVEELASILVKITNGGFNANIGSTYRSTVEVLGDDYFEMQSASKEGVIIKIKTVDVGGTLYTIEDALNTATSGQTVTVKNNTAFADKSIAAAAGYNGDDYYTVKSGVTLLLPYDGNDTRGYLAGGEDLTGVPSASNPQKYIQLTIPGMVTVTNAGKIIVGAVTSRTSTGSPQGNISGGYSEIELNGVLNSVGELSVYGNIIGSGSINATSGVVRERFEILDWRGGTIGAATFLPNGTSLSASQLLGSDYSPTEGNQFPFKQYALAGILTNLTVSANVIYSGIVNIYTDAVVVLKARITTVDLVISSNSADTNCLFALNNGATLFKQKISNNRTKIVISGGATGHQIDLTISVGATIHMKSGLVAFPVAGTLDLYLEDGIYTSNYGYKFMPGSSLTIRQGDKKQTTKLILTNKEKGVLVYDTDDITYANNPSDPSNSSTGKWEYYPSGRPDAVLKVGSNCTLQISGKFGGTIQGEQNSILIITNDATLTNTLSEGWGAKDGTLSVTFTYNETSSKTKTAQGHLSTGDGNFTQGATYYYKNNAWYAEGTVVYKFRVDNGDGALIDLPIESVDNPNGPTYPYGGELMLQNPTSGDLVFIGWCLDENGKDGFVSIITGIDYLEGVTIYGIFKKVSADQLYTFEFDTSFNDGSVSGLMIDRKNILKDGFEFDPNTDDGINQVIHSLDNNVLIAYCFDGWYMDKDYTTPYSIDQITSQPGGTPITLYAKWKAKVKQTINLAYVNYHHKGIFGSTNYLADDPSFTITYEGETLFSGSFTNNKEQDSKTHTSDKFEFYLCEGQEVYITFTHGGTKDETNSQSYTAEGSKTWTYTCSVDKNNSQSQKLT